MTFAAVRAGPVIEAGLYAVTEPEMGGPM